MLTTQLTKAIIQAEKAYILLLSVSLVNSLPLNVKKLPIKIENTPNKIVHTNVTLNHSQINLYTENTIFPLLPEFQSFAP